jgi:uncharacterized protein (TIGR00251 family)
MIFNVRVIPKASRNLIKKEESIFKVYLTSPATDGLANKHLIRLLSEYCGVKKYDIRIIKGEKSKDKIVEINPSILRSKPKDRSGLILRAT